MNFFKKIFSIVFGIDTKTKSSGQIGAQTGEQVGDHAINQSGVRPENYRGGSHNRAEFNGHMGSLFQKHEIKFIAITAAIFIGTVLFLVVFGLIPSEFQVSGGETFEQKTRNAVREIIDGKTGDTNENVGANQVKTQTNITSNDGANTGGDISANTQSNSVGQSNTAGSVVKETKRGTLTSLSIKAENPTRLVISSIGVDANIVNPNSTSFEVLDAGLTKGAVRYPGSGYPGSGNMFIFGHSTSFAAVQNTAYKVFNKLKDAKTGETVTVYGSKAVYTYKVTSVKKVDKEKALVTFDTKNDMLTLSTCDSFGSASDRYVVEAEFVSASLR